MLERRLILRDGPLDIAVIERWACVTDPEGPAVKQSGWAIVKQPSVIAEAIAADIG